MKYFKNLKGLKENIEIYLLVKFREVISSQNSYF